MHRNTVGSYSQNVRIKVLMPRPYVALEGYFLKDELAQQGPDVINFVKNKIKNQFQTFLSETWFSARKSHLNQIMSRLSVAV